MHHWLPSLQFLLLLLLLLQPRRWQPESSPPPCRPPPHLVGFGRAFLRFPTQCVRRSLATATIRFAAPDLHGRFRPGLRHIIIYHHAFAFLAAVVESLVMRNISRYYPDKTKDPFFLFQTVFPSPPPLRVRPVRRLSLHNTAGQSTGCYIPAHKEPSCVPEGPPSNRRLPPVSRLAVARASSCGSTRGYEPHQPFSAKNVDAARQEGVGVIGCAASCFVVVGDEGLQHHATHHYIMHRPEYFGLERVNF